MLHDESSDGLCQIQYWLRHYVTRNSHVSYLSTRLGLQDQGLGGRIFNPDAHHAPSANYYLRGIIVAASLASYSHTSILLTKSCALPIFLYYCSQVLFPSTTKYIVHPDDDQDDCFALGPFNLSGTFLGACCWVAKG